MQDNPNHYLGGFFNFREDMKRLHENWGWLLALGSVLLLFGVLALAVAGMTTVASIVFFGSLLAVSGGVQVLHAFSFRIGHGFLLNLLAGILYIVVGVLMISRPAAGALSLTLLISAFLLVGGLFRSVWSAMARFPSWGWGVFSGLLTSVLGIYIGATLPVSALWTIGAFIGIEMICSGLSWIMLSFAARKYEAIETPTRQVVGSEYPRKVS